MNQLLNWKENTAETVQCLTHTHKDHSSILL